jgi:hypothetical protein
MTGDPISTPPREETGAGFSPALGGSATTDWEGSRVVVKTYTLEEDKDTNNKNTFAQLSIIAERNPAFALSRAYEIIKGDRGARSAILSAMQSGHPFREA